MRCASIPQDCTVSLPAVSMETSLFTDFKKTFPSPAPIVPFQERSTHFALECENQNQRLVSDSCHSFEASLQSYQLSPGHSSGSFSMLVFPQQLTLIAGALNIRVYSSIQSSSQEKLSTKNLGFSFDSFSDLQTESCTQMAEPELSSVLATDCL